MGNKDRRIKVTEAKEIGVEGMAKALDYALQLSMDTPCYRDGVEWYPTAHDDCETLAKWFDIDHDIAIGVVAAISPAMQWRLTDGSLHNLDTAAVVIHEYRKDTPVEFLPVQAGYSWNPYRKAYRILSGEPVFAVLEGKEPWRKVPNFAKCILEPASPEHICIDRHSTSISMGQWQDRSIGAQMGKNTYAMMAEAHRVVAERHNLLPSQVQAITWSMRVDGYLNDVPDMFDTKGL